MVEISLQAYCEQIEDIIEQGKYAEAVAHGRHILKQYPKHVTSYQLLGKAMLDSGRSEDAADMFHRVLSANPEDLVAWVGMSELHAQQGELDAAAWYLERAYELAADNEILEEELRRLYGQRDRVEPERIQLTRGALARLYLKGDLLSRAVDEFRDLLTEQPERADLRVALAEALWRNEQRLEASEVCQKLLDDLPYCLKANLLLGEIWTSSGREEGQTYLQRAEALDPENRTAQAIFGTASPLQPREVRITQMEPPSTAEERPDWMDRVEIPAGEKVPSVTGETALADITSALEAQIEIPAWLESVAAEEPYIEEMPATAPPTLAPEPPPEQLLEGVTPTPAEEAAEWAADLEEQFPEEEPEAVVAEEAAFPEWLSGLDLEPSEIEEMAQQVIEPEAEPISMPEPSVEEEEIPDWLSQLGVEPATEEEMLIAAPAEELPVDWLAGIRDQFTEEAEMPPEAVAAVEEAAPAAEEELAPGWLEGEGLPSGDDALAWLEQLAAGKEEELRAQADAEAAARMAEIMGRPAPTVAEEAPPAAEAPPEQAIVPPVEEGALAPAEIPDWMRELAPPEEALAMPTVEDILTPELLESEELTSPGEALAWLEELAQAEGNELDAKDRAKAEARLAAIMGPSIEVGAPITEAVLEEAITAPEEAVAPAVEIPEWMQELAPPEVTVPEAAPPTVEAGPEAAEEAAIPPVEEAFGWISFGQPEVAPTAVAAVEPPLPMEEPLPTVEEELAPDWLEGEGMPSGDDALAWLERLAAGKEEELRAQADAEAEARMAEIMGRRPAPAEAPEVEAAPEVAIAPPAEEPVVVAEEAVAPPIEEPVVVVEEAVAPPIEEPVVVAEEEIPPTVEAPPEVPAIEPAIPAEPFAAERAYLKEHPRDYQAWLELARALWQDDERQQAMEAYTRLIRAGKLLENVIPDLEGYVQQWPDVSIRRVLGDAYMKDGRLDDALDVYRRALETL